MTRKPIAILALSLLIAVPAALALAAEGGDPVPAGSGRIGVLITNTADAGLVRVRVLDAEGREAIDDLRRLPADGGWGVDVPVPVGAYTVELERRSGVWPFAARLESSGVLDLRGCAHSQGLFAFTTTFDGADERVVGPIATCLGEDR